MVQETFLAAHQGLNRLHSVNSPKAWLLTIAHNKLVDFLRRRPVHVPLQAESLAAAGGEAANLFAQEILEQLAEPERTIVYGLYVEGLTYRELGEMLGIPKGTVKSKAHYARNTSTTGCRGDQGDETARRVHGPGLGPAVRHALP